MASEFDSVAYNLRHTDLMKRRAQGYEQRGYTVTVESQNKFRIFMAGATIYGRMDLEATRNHELVIIDAKAAKPSEAHVVHVMLYMLLLQLQGTQTQGRTVTSELYYGEDHTVAMAAGGAGKEFRDLVGGLIGRLTAKEPHRRVPKRRRQQQLLLRDVGTVGLAHQQLRTLITLSIIPPTAPLMVFLGHAARLVIWW